MNALRSASLCIFFSRLGGHCTRVDTFLLGCVFVLGLAIGLLFKKIIWHPEDWQAVPGLGLRVYCVLREVWGEGGNQLEGRRRMFIILCCRAVGT